MTGMSSKSARPYPIYEEEHPDSHPLACGAADDAWVPIHIVEAALCRPRIILQPVSMPCVQIRHEQQHKCNRDPPDPPISC